MPISIGSAISFRNPENNSWKFTPDDRQTRIETVGGLIVQDNGLVESGEILSCQLLFTAANWLIVRSYWVARTLVTVTDHYGNNYTNRRVIVKSEQFIDRFHYVIADLEFWGA